MATQPASCVKARRSRDEARQLAEWMRRWLVVGTCQGMIGFAAGHAHWGLAGSSAQTLEYIGLVSVCAKRLTSARACRYIDPVKLGRDALPENWYYVLTCIALAVVAANLFATAVVMRSDFYSPLQRGLQLALVWLVPVVGAACCVSFASIHRRGVPGPAKPFPKPDSFGLPGGEGNSL